MLLLILLGWRLPVARGQYVLEDVHDKNRYKSSHLILPFAFYTPSDRFGGGFAWQTSGLLQPQTDSFGFGIADVNGTYGIGAGSDDLQLKPIDRLFLDTQFGFFRYDYDTLYIDGNPHFVGQPPAGTNDSSEQNHVIRRHSDDWGNVTLKYLLPIGGGRDVVINHYVLEDGMVQSGATGGHGWNPLRTGRTYLQLTPFYRFQTIETSPNDQHDDENGLRFGAVYDNRNFPLNPSSGNVTKFTVSRDFGLFDSSNPWTNVSGEFSQFLDLGHSRLFRQQVLAMDLWTSYSVTWGQRRVDGRRAPSDAPPFYEGAVLGGTSRLRGFSSNRFWDRAALYATAELRLVPYWNPLRKIGILKRADVTWMQWVVFAEAGRVAGEYSPDLFHHLKGDVGFGLRILANDTIVRFDVAASNEGFAVWATLNEPF